MLAASPLSSGVAFADDSAAAPATSSEADSDAARSNARQLATEGSEAYRNNQFDLAYDRFNRAFRLVGVPALGVWSARSLGKSGRLVESAERYREVIKLTVPPDAPAAFSEAVGNARAELAELVPRIPNVIVHVENPGTTAATVTLNGKPLPAELLDVKQRVNPGKIELVATRGSETVREEVVLSERETKELTLRLPEEAVVATPVATTATGDSSTAQSGPNLQTWGLISMGVGAAFLVDGIVTGLIALDQSKSLEETCGTDRVCPPSSNGDVDSFDTMRALSTVGFIGAGVFAATGATLYFVGAPSEPVPASARVGLYTTGTSLGLRGAF